MTSFLLYLFSPLTLVLGAGGYLWWRYRFTYFTRRQRWQIGVVGGIFLLLCLPSTGRLLNAMLVAPTQASVAQRAADLPLADLIIVPTGGMHHVGGAGWQPSRHTYLRTAAAYQLQAQLGGRVPLLLTGGRTMGAAFPSEAAVAQQGFEQGRAEITPVLLEENSLNIFENAVEVARLITERGVQQPVLVVSEEHLWRTLATFRARGINPIPYPVATLERGRLSLLDFLPSAHGLHQNTTALHEMLKLLGGWVKGDLRWYDMLPADISS